MSDKLKQLVMFWNERSAEILNIHTNPGHDSRRFAVVQIAIHDTLNYFEQRYRQYSQVDFLPKRYKAASPEEAVNSAAYEALKWVIKDIGEYNEKLINEKLPPIVFNKQEWTDRVTGWYNSQKAKEDTFAVALGQIWAEAIVNNRESDGSKGISILTTYPVNGGPNDIGVFRADYYKMPPAVTPPENNKFLVGFGDVTPLVLTSAVQFRQQLNYTDDQRARELEEAKKLGTGKYTIEDEGLKNKVEFWSNIKQHVIWNNFARKLIEQNYMDAWQTARIFALIHTAMADGAISMFKDVYHFKHWRPATAINAADGINPLSDAAWKTRFATPRVPEYPSTFGIFGGAVGEILESIFPVTNVRQIDLTFLNSDNIQKSIAYVNISDAVNDNAITRIYCGWNFRKSAVESITQGRQIGRYVFENKFQYVPIIVIPRKRREPKPTIPKIPQLRKIR